MELRPYVCVCAPVSNKNFSRQAELALKNSPYYKRLQRKIQRLTDSLEAFTELNIQDKINTIKSDIGKLEEKLEIANDDLAHFQKRQQKKEEAVEQAKEKKWRLGSKQR